MNTSTQAMTTTSEAADTTVIGVAPRKCELISLLSEKYGRSAEETDSIDRTGLMRLVDTLDFLSNNLPPNSLLK